MNKKALSGALSILSLVCIVISLARCGFGENSSEHFTDNSTAEKFYKKGTTLMQQGFYQDAIPPLTEAIKNDEHFVAAFINRSLCWNKIQDFKKALQDAESALRGNSESSYAWFHKAEAEKGLHKYTDAAQDYQTAAKYEPEAGYRYNQLAVACLESAGQTAKAKELQANIDKATDEYSLIGRGLAKYKNGQYIEAVKEFTAAIAKDPRAEQAYYNRGLCQATLGRYKEALEDYNQVLKLDSSDAQAYYLRGWDKFFMGDFAGAAEDFVKHVGMNDVGESHSPYSVIACVLAYRKMNHEAGADYMLKWWQPYEYDKWPRPVLKFLRHENTVNDVLAAANTNDLMTEAKTYIGMQYSVEGKINEAKEYLHWVEVYGNRSFSEYQLALSELARIAKAK